MGRTGWIVLFSAILFVFVVGGWIIYMDWMESRFGEMEQRGLFGDQFGGINALFTGLAFAGLIITIILQSQELRLQRQELRETRNEFIQQNETLKLQRFENTFFNLLDVHNKIVDNLKYRYPESGVFGGSATMEGRSAFRMMYRSLQKKTILIANPNDMSKEDFEKLTKIYKIAITENNDLSNITYYFQSLATVLEFIATSDLLSVKSDSRKEEKNRRTYFKIFISTQ